MSGDRSPGIVPEELADWISHFGMSNANRMGLRHAPMAFAEQGVAMLSGVLRSPRALHDETGNGSEEGTRN